MSKKHRCKNCGSSQLGVSRYQGIEKLFSVFLFMVPLRCRDCFRRGMYTDALFANNLRTGLWTVVGALVILMFVGSVYNGSNTNAYSGNGNTSQPKDQTLARDSKLSGVKQNAIYETAVDEELLSSASQIRGTEMDVLPLQSAVPISSSVDQEIPDIKPVAIEPKKSVDFNSVIIPKPDHAVIAAQHSKEKQNKDIRRALEQWRTAWENSQLDDYLNAYSNDFAPDANQTYSYWLSNRSRIVGKKEFRKIEISDLEFAFNKEETAAGIEFKQQYYSESHRDVVLKRMYMKMHQGEWKIARETVADIK